MWKAPLHIWQTALQHVERGWGKYCCFWFSHKNLSYIWNDLFNTQQLTILSFHSFPVRSHSGWVTCTLNCLCPVWSHVNNAQWSQALLARISEYVHLCLICCLCSEPMQPRHRGTGWTGINYTEKGYVGLTVSLARPEFTMKALAISRPLQDGHLSAFAQGLQYCLVDLRLNYSDLTYKITPRESSTINGHPPGWHAILLRTPKVFVCYPTAAGGYWKKMPYVFVVIG